MRQCENCGEWIDNSTDGKWEGCCSEECYLKRWIVK